MSEGLTAVGLIGGAAGSGSLARPIEPDHLRLLEPALRARIQVTRAYGEPYGASDVEMEALVGAVRPRQAILASCALVAACDVQDSDVVGLGEGQVVWSHASLVDRPRLTETLVQRRATWIAWERMVHGARSTVPLQPVLHRLDELAGYAAVLHALQLRGMTGLYGPRHRAAVIGASGHGRGALHALHGLGFRDVTCYSRLRPDEVPAQVPGVAYRHFERVPGTRDAVARCVGEAEIALGLELGGFDVIVNGTVQDPDDALRLIRATDLVEYRRGTLIIDVRPERGLGFEFARPTTREAPTVEVAEGVVYYGVDAPEQTLWRSATFERSRALLAYLPTLLAGRPAWHADPVLHGAIQIDDGQIRDPKILEHQKREAEWPHAQRPGG